MRLLGPHLLASAFLLATGTQPGSAQSPKSLLETDPLAPSSRLVLRLHAGGYQIRSSTDGRMHVSETRDGTPTGRNTEIRFHQTSTGSHLEIDPPTGHNGSQITITLPPCASLDLRLTAGELVFDTVPCETTEASLHTGEVRATLGDPERYRTVSASVLIGEVDAPGLGRTKDDEQHGGFFRSFNRNGAGARTFTAHVGTGQITLERPRQ